MRLFLLAIVLLTTTSIARADDCGGASDQASLNECAGKSFKKSDAELNKLYGAITKRLKDDADTTKLLVTAQRAWIGFRDAECTFSSSGSAEGSVYPMIYAGCLDGLTQRRIDDLKGYLNCEEGDMSCPVPRQ